MTMLGKVVYLSVKSTQSLRILVVSSNPRALAEIKKGLLAQFEINIAATQETAVSNLNTYDTAAVIIFLDHTDGTDPYDYSALSSCAAAKGLPLIFLAASDDEHDEAAAFAVGASDYVIKRTEYGSLINRLALRIAASECAQRRPAPPDIPPDAPRPEELLNGKRILMAEDVQLNQDIIKAMLSDVTGLTLDFADNGIIAVEQFTANPRRYDLIFMDIQMPEMDGLSATKAIRRLDGETAARKIPIIALTASTDDEDIAAFWAAGMNDYLEKPMDYDSFISTCIKYLAMNNP